MCTVVRHGTISQTAETAQDGPLQLPIEEGLTEEDDSNMSHRKPKALLSAFENAFVASFASALAACFQMPIISWKYSLQQNLPLPVGLAAWYRGLGVRILSIAPITSLQLVSNGLIEKHLFHATDSKPMTQSQRLLCACLAGIISSPVYNIMDLLQIQQQKMGLTLVKTLKELFRKGGVAVLGSGVGFAALREALYVTGYLGLSPIFAGLVRSVLGLRNANFCSNVVGAFLGSLPGGLIACYLTQPLDTGKTLFQGSDVSRRKFSSPQNAIATLYESEGIGGLYRGAPQRALVITIIYFLLPFFRELVVQYKTIKLYNEPGAPQSPNFKWDRRKHRQVAPHNGGDKSSFHMDKSST